MSAEEFALAQRKALWLPESNVLLIYVTWITNSELEYTIKYPESLAVDTTMQTNKEERPLLLTAGIDNTHRNFASVRSFLPSQCAWTFQFTFEHAFPDILGVHTVTRIKQVCYLLSMTTF